MGTASGCNAERRKIHFVEVEVSGYKQIPESAWDRNRQGAGYAIG